MRKGTVCIVEGLIGAGKSSFTQELHEAVDGSMALMEPDEVNGQNPYLASFYGDMNRWAFTMQIHLLQARFRMHQHAQWVAMSGKGPVFLDRSYFGDTAFARLQLLQGTMTSDEYETYRSIYSAMTASVLLPNVCVLLEVSPEVAAERIDRRASERAGRRCEKVIDLEYLRHLDVEIRQMVDTLGSQGVEVVRIPYNEDRPSGSSRKAVVEKVSDLMRKIPTPDLFASHRRSIAP
jgi:deoxyadenosine/deoxycytidine kinase